MGYVLQATDKEGKVSGYYTGKAGKGCIGMQSEAFIYSNFDLAWDKAHLFDARKQLTGFSWVVEEI